MSSHYFLYTEIKHNGKWYCLNKEMPRIKDNTTSLACTYYSGSRSYFHEAADKLEELNDGLNLDDASDVIKEKYGKYKDDKFISKYAVDFESIKSVMPKNMKHEYHGFVKKDTIFRYESNDIEEIYESITPEEYSKLDEKAKQAYEYYEWDDPMGWFVHFKEIIEHVNWQMYEWYDVNFMEEPEKIRIIMFIF